MFVCDKVQKKISFGNGKELRSAKRKERERQNVAMRSNNVFVFLGESGYRSPVPPACEAGALPLELIPLNTFAIGKL